MICSDLVAEYVELPSRGWADFFLLIFFSVFIIGIIIFRLKKILVADDNNVKTAATLILD